MERMNNKKRNTIIVLAVMFLVLVVLCIWGLSGGKSKHDGGNVIGQNADVDGNQSAASLDKNETEIRDSQHIADKQGNGETLDSTEGQSADSQMSDDVDISESDASDKSSDEASKSKGNTKTGTGVNTQKRRTGNSITLIEGIDYGAAYANSQNYAAESKKDENYTADESVSEGASGGTNTPSSGAYNPPEEDINLADEIETDESGAIEFPFVSYQ